MTSTIGSTPRPTNNSSNVPSDVVGRYPISGEIARGGMGVILRGHDPNLGRDLAIKVLLDSCDDPEVVRSFIEEAQIGGQLQHPGIIPVYELGVDHDNRPYFTMELVQGRTLADLLRERSEPGQNLPHFLGIFQQICLTMAYAHDRGVIHRDLKPGNIMVGSFGEVQVMDWGVAKVRDHVADKSASDCDGEIRTLGTGTDSPASLTGSVSGTPAYMAPEQARGDNDRVDTPADVFALGSILCEILTGRPAYEGTSTDDTFWQAVQMELGAARTRLDEVSADPPLVMLAKRCLEPEPDARPRDAGVVAHEIAAYLHGVQERLRQAELDRAATAARTAAEKRSQQLKQTLRSLIALTLFGLALAGWWAYEKRARLLSEVERDLTTAEQQRQQENWPEACRTVERAAGRLGDLGAEAYQQRLQRVRDDLKMIDRLDGIRLSQAEVADGHFNRDAALPRYTEAFRDFGLDVLVLDPDEAAKRIRESAISVHLLAALDDWLLLLHDSGQPEWKRVLEVVQKADDDDRRTPLREVWAAEDWPQLRELAQPKHIAAMPSATALFVSIALLRAKAPEQALQVLEAAQREHPNDFWINHRLAYTLHNHTNRQEEALADYRAALAIRPRSPGVYINMSLVLDRLGRYAEAEAVCRKAIELDPKYAEAYTNLAFFLRQRGRLSEAEEPLQKALELKPHLTNALLNLFYLREKQGRLEEAEEAMRQVVDLDSNNATLHHDVGVFLLSRGKNTAAKEEFQKAVALQPKNARYHFQVAYALDKLGDRDEAETEYRTAIALDDNLATAHTNLGAVLYAEGRFAEAEQEHRQAIALDSQLAQAHRNLGVTLARQGKYVEAEREYRTTVELGGEVPEQWLKNAERSAEREKQLPAVLAGTVVPKDATEWLELARLCQAKQQYAGAVKCYQSAFILNPNLATDYRGGGGRCNAARMAVLAASGQGVEILDETARGRLRQQALEWLRADVTGWNRGLETGTTAFRANVRQMLESMQRDSALAAVRDDTALAKLPEAERVAFRQLWTAVAELLQRVGAKEDH